MGVEFFHMHLETEPRKIANAIPKHQFQQNDF